MKKEFIVFSDIHGNSEALSFFLKAEPFEEGKQYIFLGDLAGYYYDPALCMEQLRAIPNLISVRGNHDEKYIDAYEDEERTAKICEKYSSAYRDKDPAVLAFLRSLPVREKITCGCTEILIQHGSPDDSVRGRLYPDTTLPVFPDNRKRVILTGHTHYRMVRREGNTLWLNPGSLGQPRDGKGFSYAALWIDEESGNAEVDFRTVTPDLSGLEKMIKERDPDRPYLIEVLHRGENDHVSHV